MKVMTMLEKELRKLQNNMEKEKGDQTRDKTMILKGFGDGTEGDEIRIWIEAQQVNLKWNNVEELTVKED